MSQAFDHIIQELDLISQQEKYALRQLLDQGLKMPNDNGLAVGKLSAFGWAKGRIAMGVDFDAPLEDFKDYVE